MNPTRVTLSEKVKGKHKKMIKVLQKAAADKKIEIADEKCHLGKIKQPKKEAIFNLHSIMLHEELAGTMGKNPVAAECTFTGFCQGLGHRMVC